MNKFLSGALCGLLVGAALTFLLLERERASGPDIAPQIARVPGPVSSNSVNTNTPISGPARRTDAKSAQATQTHELVPQSVSSSLPVTSPSGSTVTNSANETIESIRMLDAHREMISKPT